VQKKHGRVLQFADGFGFDLSHALAGDFEDAAYFFERVGVGVADAVAEFDDFSFAVGVSKNREILLLPRRTLFIFQQDILGHSKVGHSKVTSTDSVTPGDSQGFFRDILWGHSKVTSTDSVTPGDSQGFFRKQSGLLTTRPILPEKQTPSFPSAAFPASPRLAGNWGDGWSRGSVGFRGRRRCAAGGWRCRVARRVGWCALR
jgi:hypothetical protein